MSYKVQSIEYTSELYQSSTVKDKYLHTGHSKDKDCLSN